MVTRSKSSNFTDEINNNNKSIRNRTKLTTLATITTTQHLEDFKKKMYETDSESSYDSCDDDSSSDVCSTSSSDGSDHSNESDLDSYDTDEESNEIYERYAKALCDKGSYNNNIKQERYKTFPPTKKVEKKYDIPSCSARTTTFDENGVTTTTTVCRNNDNDIVIKEISDDKNETNKNEMFVGDKHRLQGHLSLDNSNKNEEDLGMKSSTSKLRHSQSIELLYSPKLARRGIISNKLNNEQSLNDHISNSPTMQRKFKQKSHTIDDDRLRLTKPTLELNHLGNNNETNMNKTVYPLSPGEEGLLMKTNPFLLSPNLRRKQIDITNSPAYKQIYAHNLRLYSAVLAKQIAESGGQLGREMNEIRKLKIKEKALKLTSTTTTKTTTESKFSRSKSFSGFLDVPKQDIRRSHTSSFTAYEFQEEGRRSLSSSFTASDFQEKGRRPHSSSFTACDFQEEGRRSLSSSFTASDFQEKGRRPLSSSFTASDFQQEGRRPHSSSFTANDFQRDEHVIHSNIDNMKMTMFDITPKTSNTDTQGKENKETKGQKDQHNVIKTVHKETLNNNEDKLDDYLAEIDDTFVTTQTDVNYRNRFHQCRNKAANVRKAYCRKRIESFEMTIQQADLLLEKIKASKKLQMVPTTTL